MKARIWMLVAGLLVALTVALLLAPTTWAQGPANGQQPGMGAQAHGRGPGNGGPGNSLVTIAARVIGMTQADLVAELQDGTTSIADVAADRGTPLDDIVDEAVAARLVRLQAAVDAGRIAPADAAAREATMRANVRSRLEAPWTAQGPRGGTGCVDADEDGVCANCTGMPGSGNGRRGGRP